MTRNNAAEADKMHDIHLSRKYFQVTMFQIFACVLFQMQTQSNSNRWSFKYINHYDEK